MARGDYNSGFDNENCNIRLTLDNNTISIYKSLPDTVKNIIAEEIGHRLCLMLYNLDECESPIEQLLAFILDCQEHIFSDIADDGCYIAYRQHEIEVKDKKYRADICIMICINEKTYKFVIECDGHEFHEKTKKQVIQKNMRDRDLIAEGYHVIHFSGSEIVNNPHLCVKSIRDILYKIKRDTSR